jgi:hypothetical protein
MRHFDLLKKKLKTKNSGCGGDGKLSDADCTPGFRPAAKASGLVD